MQPITHKWAKEVSGVLQRTAACVLIKQGGSFLAVAALKKSFSKLVAVSLTGVVAAFGTAGTGTAISTLSGAAAQSALLAWFGLGSATVGAFTLPAITAAGTWLAWRTFKRAGRDTKDLTKEEQNILHRCWSLGIMLNDEAKKKGKEKPHLAPEQIDDIKQLNADMRHYLRDDGCQIQIARGKIKRNHTALSKLLAQLS